MKFGKKKNLRNKYLTKRSLRIHVYENKKRLEKDCTIERRESK